MITNHLLNGMIHQVPFLPEWMMEVKKVGVSPIVQLYIVASSCLSDAYRHFALSHDCGRKSLLGTWDNPHFSVVEIIQHGLASQSDWNMISVFNNYMTIYV